jgi:lipopolysaccharide/colanic/teichoic acid biosynthesis glycosyltransferase
MEKEKQVSPGIVLSQSATFKSGPTTAPKVREPLLKRPLDVILSAFMLLLSLPVSLPIAIAIKLEDRGPIFYRQKRWGMGRKRFRAYKFRTMVPDAEKGNAVWAQKNDPRVTRVGRILRKTHIDEFPQFINILRGEMSAVGLRAERMAPQLNRLSRFPQGSLTPMEY